MFLNRQHLRPEILKRSHLWWGYKLLLVVFILLGGLQLILANHVATFGARLNELNREAERLDQENAAVQAGLSRYSSLGWISGQGGTLGLIKSPKIVFAASPLPVALR